MQKMKSRDLAILISSGLVTAGIFLLDLSASRGVADGTLYLFPIFLAQYFGSPGYLRITALLTSVLIVLGGYLSDPCVSFCTDFLNRLLSLGALWLAVFAFSGQRRALLQSESIAKELSQRVDDLERFRRISISLLEDIQMAKTDSIRTEKSFRLVVESSPHGMIMIDRDGKIKLVNSETEKIFGYGRGELLDQQIEMLVPKSFRAEHPTHRSGFFHNPKVRAMGVGRDLFGVKKDGSEIPVEIALTPLSTSEGLLVLASIVDITVRKKLEQEIVQRNRELETLLHITSHDLKEPLRAIENFSQMLSQEHAKSLNSEGKDLFLRVTKASQRMGMLLDDILHLTRAKKIEKPTVAIEGEAIVREALARLEEKIKATGATVQLIGKLPTLYVDKTWGVEAIYNLISNALKFHKADHPPEIEIASYQPQDGDPAGIGLVVRDRGTGVPTEYAQKIFELFRRAVGHEVEGTGAGLAIVHEIAQRHGGNAWVKSRKGGGSEFNITFGT